MKKVPVSNATEIARLKAKAARNAAKVKAKAVAQNSRTRTDEALFLIIVELAVIPAAHTVLGVLGHVHLPF